MNYGTGYWGVPGLELNNKVHITWNEKPICGVKFRKGAEYQWCARRIVMTYVTCEHCKQYAEKHILKTLENYTIQVRQRFLKEVGIDVTQTN